MSARKPVCFYEVHHHSETAEDDVVGHYFSYTGAKQACDDYRRASGYRWQPWQIASRDHKRVPNHAHCETAYGEDQISLAIITRIIVTAGPLKGV